LDIIFYEPGSTIIEEEITNPFQRIKLRHVDGIVEKCEKVTAPLIGLHDEARAGLK